MNSRKRNRKLGISLDRFIPKNLQKQLTILWSKIKPRGKWTRKKILVYAGTISIVMVILGYVSVLGVFAWYARDLPSPGQLSNTGETSTVFLDRNDEIIYQMFKDKNRVPVDIEDISEYLQQGTVAIEDKRFYEHQGISQFGIMRAAVSTIIFGEVQGGSTITQQLIKNVLLNSERTISRKVKEAILAGEVEKRYEKDQILEMYLNEAPYGGSFWGVGSAAKGYFDKEPIDLNLVESAILAGLPQSPTRYSPYFGDEQAWKNRAKDVLRRMEEDGYITQEERDTAYEDVDNYEFGAPNQAINAPHFVFYVRDFIEDQFGSGSIEKGLQIKTTLDLDAQNEIQDIVKNQIEEMKDKYDLGNGSVVMVDSQLNEILAMVGSYDFNNEDYGKFNTATALRQPGSALKPLVYATAFEQKYTPSDVIMDVETEFSDEYKPVNYDGTFRGPVQMRFALANSLNIPAVKVLALVGVESFLSQAYEMGLNTLEPTTENQQRFGLSIALGGGEVRLLELTSAYSVFANGGMKKELQFIEEIKDHNGNVIYKKPNVNEQRVLSEEVSFLISHILSDDNARAQAFGTGSLLNIPGNTVAVKTGTTDEKRDNWAVGYTQDITVGVWVGNNDNSVLNPEVASGTTGATTIWNEVMTAMLEKEKYNDGIIEIPESVIPLEIDAYLGGLPKEGYPTRSEYFIEGTEPQDIASFYQTLRVNGDKLANEVQIREGNYEEKEFVVLTEDDPTSVDDRNRWQEGIDAWLETQTDEKLKPPKEVSSDSAEDVAIDLRDPDDKRKYDKNKITVEAKFASASKIKEIKIYINGEERKKFEEDRTEIKEEFELSDGTYEIKVRAENEKGNSSEKRARIGINREWDEEPSDDNEDDSSEEPTNTPEPTDVPDDPTNTPEPTETEPEPTISISQEPTPTPED